MSEKLQEPKYAFVAGGVMNRASGEMIPHDEPVFIFRARDRHAARTLRFYATTIGRSPDDHWEAVMARVEDFERFAREHPERMKEPDTDLAARAEARPAPEPKRHREIVDAIWQELCEKDDRNSPAEYPDMALVTHDELSGYVAVAMAEAAWQASQARPAPAVDREAVAGPAYTSVGYQYRFSDPMSGHPVWRTSSEQWNGQRPQETREIFALLSPATSPGEGSSGAESAARIASDHAASETLRKSEVNWKAEWEAASSEVIRLTQQLQRAARERNETIARLSRMCGDA